MSEQNKDEQQDAEHQSGSGSESQPSSEAHEISSTDEAPDTSEPRGKTSSRRSGNAPAWLALLLALGAAGLAGWQWWQSRTDDQPGRFGSQIEQQASAIESQSGRLDQLGERVGAVETRLEELAGSLDSRDFDPNALRSEIESLADTDADLRRQLTSLQGRLDQAVSDLESQLEQTGAERYDQITESVADLRQQVTSLSGRLDQAVSDLESQLEQAGAERSERIAESVADARFRLGLVEVAGLLRLGQSRAELAADPAGAVAAYRRAQSRLEAIEDDRVEQLRQLVARELEALRSVESTDWPALAGQLSALESQTAQWPVAGAQERGAEKRAVEDESGEETAGWWSNVRASLGGLVRVTPREAAPLTSAGVVGVRARLRLHLAAAPAAAARRSTGELTHHLEVAEGLIRAHFDTSAESVSRSLDSISEAASVDLPSLPELGSALAEAERRLAGS